MKSNLVALGSAAVLVVYSAGYARTRSAAERFADESNERRTPVRRAAASAPALTPTVAPHVDARPAANTDSATIATAPATPAHSSAAPAIDKKPEHATTKTTNVPEKTTRPTIAADTSATTPVKAAEPIVVAPPIVSPPATATTTTTTTPPPVDTATKADTAHVQLKDGTFSGWGTSRHGDIEAAVQIKDGRIASAFIVQCLTQYSCSWISMLPGQVVTRQSSEVDYVSGATQSSNAFYYAIVQALSKAK